MAGVYLPPMLIAATIGSLFAIGTAILLNRFRLSRFLVYPPLDFVALTVLYTGLVGALFLPF